MATGGHILEHGTSRSGRWLREHRLRFTLSVALVEGVLVVVHVLHWWTIVPLAAVAIAFWWYAGRTSRSYSLRQASWIFAASQTLVLLVPLVLFIATTIAVAVIALIAIAALIMLFTERS
jgi:hypothetical protein